MIREEQQVISTGLWESGSVRGDSFSILFCSRGEKSLVNALCSLLSHEVA